MGEPGWAVVVPAKYLAEAKTRLRAALEVPAVPLLLALVQDTVDAVCACPPVTEVIVVTGDPLVVDAVTRSGVRVVPDRPGAGLNPAVTHGAAHVAGGSRWVAALAGDLPALRWWELAAALRAAASSHHRGFVPDVPGTGTTLLAAPPGVPLDPRFGPGSAAAHAASGAIRLEGDWPSLRQDVDTPADLVAAARLGLGPRSAARAGGSLARLAGLARRAGTA